MTLKTFAVVTLKRIDLTEAVIALPRDEGQACKLASQYIVVESGEFLRCRMQSADLAVEQVKVICFRWDRDAARDGEPVTNTLPGVYGDEYCLSYKSVGGENLNELNTEMRQP